MAYVCPADDRGQIYCSEGCRKAGNERRLKKARATYRASPLVHEDHKEYMRGWRTQRRDNLRRVRDLGPNG